MFIIKEGTPADKIGEGTTKETLDAVNKFLEKQGMTVRTADQDQSYLKANSQKFIDEAFSLRNAQIEKDIFELTGVAKTDSNEKYYDYMKRVLSDHKSLNQTATDLKAKIEELGKTGGNAKLIEELRGELKSAQELIRKNTEEADKKIGEMKSQLLNSKLSGITSAALDQIKPTLKQLDAAIQTDVINSRLQKFNTEIEATEVEGQIMFKNKKDGSVMLNKKDGKPMNAQEVLQPYFEDIVEKGRKAGGTGSSKGDGKNGDDGNAKPAAWKEIQIDKNVVKTKVALGDHLVKEHKLDPASSDFTSAMMELGKDLPLR